MNLVQAKKEDKTTHLILSAAKSVFTAYSIGDESKICDYLFSNDNNKFSYKNTLLLRDGDHIVGLVIIYNSNFEKELAYNQEQLILSKFGKKVNVINNEALTDTFYIDTLAVDENYRNMQYGTKILTELQKRYNSLSLLVDINNQNALNLYQKLDFKIISTHEMFGGTYHKMLFSNCK